MLERFNICLIVLCATTLSAQSTSIFIEQGDATFLEEENLVELFASEPFTQVDFSASFEFQDLATKFIEFHLYPAISKVELPLEVIDSGGSLLAFVREAETVRLATPDQNGLWNVVESSDYQDIIASGEMLHVVLRQSANEQGNPIWDLVVNDQLVRHSLPILSGELIADLSAYSTADSSTIISLPNFSSANPLFEDQDNDFIPDRYEESFGLNPYANDRYSDHDGDGVTAINEYQNGTAPDIKDIDLANPHVFYIDNLHGSDANDGQSVISKGLTGPLYTFQRACEIAPAGSTIVLLQGTGEYAIPNLFSNGKQLRIISQNNLKIR